MATYVNDLRLKEIGTGESSGTWGTETNTNLELIGEAMGYGTEAVADASTATITMADGATDGFRCTFLRLTGGGQACTVTLAPNTLSHTWIIRNTTGYALTLSQGSGANVIIAAGQAKIVTTDGAGSGAVVYECLEDLELGGTLTVGIDDTGYDVKFFGATSGSYMLWDESADDLKLVGAAGLTVAGDIDVDGTSNLDVVDIDGAVDMASTLTLAGNADFNGDLDVDGTSNLDVVDIDGAVDMASTLTLAGNADFNGDLDVDGTSNLDVVDIDGAVDMASTLTLAGNADFNGDLDVDGTTNLDVTDIDGAVDMASTLQVDGVITTSDGMVITTADNTDTLQLISTDADAAVGPNLDLYRNSSSPADDDFLGRIGFTGRNDNSQDVDYGYIAWYAGDVSDGTEDGFMQMGMMKAGSSHLLLEAGATEIVFNQGSVDLDFRVESNSDTHALFVDAGNDFVGIGTDGEYSGTNANLTVADQIDIGIDDSSGGHLWLTRNAATGSIGAIGGKWTGYSTGPYINFQCDNVGGGAQEAHIRFYTVSSNSNTEKMRIAGNGAVGIGRTASQANTKLEVGGADNVPLIAAEASGVFAGLGVANSGVGLYLGTTRYAMLNANGLCFGSSDTAAANALDDYEEGTWTPTFKDLGGNLATLSTANGRYTKIGRIVILTYQVAISSKGSMTGSYCHMGNLPFSHPTDAYNGSGSTDYFSNFDTDLSQIAWDTSSTGSVMWMVGVAAAGAASSIYIPTSYIGGNESFKGQIIYSVA